MTDRGCPAEQILETADKETVSHRHRLASLQGGLGGEAGTHISDPAGYIGIRFLPFQMGQMIQGQMLVGVDEAWVDEGTVQINNDIMGMGRTPKIGNIRLFHPQGGGDNSSAADDLGVDKRDWLPPR